MNHNTLVGKKYTFEDGASIEVVQIKIRDENEPWVTYHTHQGPGIPRKLVMKYTEFVGVYGHLFGITDDNSESENI
jgi:hypothetical protein